MIIFFRLFLVTILYHICLFAHCQIPCGIYSDAMQILQIKEDLETIEKSIMMIKKLSGESDPQSFNQINRWISSKEEHAPKYSKHYFSIFFNSKNKTKFKKL